MAEWLGCTPGHGTSPAGPLMMSYLHLIEPPDGEVWDGGHLVVTQRYGFRRRRETDLSTGQIGQRGRDVLCVCHLHGGVDEQVVQWR